MAPRSGPEQLLKDAVFVKVCSSGGRFADPTVPDPERKVLIQFVANRGANDTLAETVRIVEQAKMAIKPPFKTRFVAAVDMDITQSIHGHPSSSVMNCLAVTRLVFEPNKQNRDKNYLWSQTIDERLKIRHPGSIPVLSW
ncbi:hypothetical protein N8639_01445 [bacterium]|nr:hypothetical protein [bacterium]